ncbi:MAG: hypothetical protein K8R07_00460, partial [Desulfobacterales bacterium]|nr:hypothetical protein [Desulfobacterales bacterium]
MRPIGSRPCRAYTRRSTLDRKPGASFLLATAEQNVPLASAGLGSRRVSFSRIGNLREKDVGSKNGKTKILRYILSCVRQVYPNAF